MYIFFLSLSLSLSLDLSKDEKGRRLSEHGARRIDKLHDTEVEVFRYSGPELSWHPGPVRLGFINYQYYGPRLPP